MLETFVLENAWKAAAQANGCMNQKDFSAYYSAEKSFAILYSFIL